MTLRTSDRMMCSTMAEGPSQLSKQESQVTTREEVSKSPTDDRAASHCLATSSPVSISSTQERNSPNYLVTRYSLAAIAELRRPPSSRRLDHSTVNRLSMRRREPMTRQPRPTAISDRSPPSAEAQSQPIALAIIFEC